MRKGNITLRMVAGALLFCLVLIPISSSVSMTQDRSPSPSAPFNGGWVQEEMREKEIIGITAAVVAVGAFMPLMTDDYKNSVSQQQ
jgi:hypothetical protein